MVPAPIPSREGCPQGGVGVEVWASDRFTPSHPVLRLREYLERLISLDW